MWRGVLLGVAVLVLLAFGGFLCFAGGARFAENMARKEERAGVWGAQHLRLMASLLNDMINPTDLGEFSTLNTVHRERALRLLADYNNKFRKGSK